ncbi:MAG: hypothetical protein INH34_14985 [Phycisphaerales bacterium]|nr:hypothetical protein [Phycisphaerales bacterium]
MAARLQSRVPAADAGLCLLDWLARRFAYFDADRWRAAIASGTVQRNGAVAATGDEIAAGDLVAYTPRADAAAEPDVPVLHADDDLVVVDKPAGMVVQHASGAPMRTFLARLAQRHPPTGGARRLESIHRLDRDTSGVLLVGRSPAGLRAWSDHFASGAIAKEYLAIVAGEPAADAYALAAPIGPAPHAAVRSRQAVLPPGAQGARTARTDVVVVARWPGHALLRLRPHTGRTHQLRVHLADAGWPIVHDPLYGQSDASYLRWVADRKAADPNGENPAPTRHLLHAAKVALKASGPAPERSWTAPLPADFTALLAASGAPQCANLPL